MITAIIFDLWETLGTKNVQISKTLFEKFNIKNTSDSLIKYEHSIQLKQYDSLEDLAKSFLKEFNIERSIANVNFVQNLLQEGLDKATLFNGMELLLKNFSKKFKLGILSNTTCFESQVIKNWNIDSLFNAQIYSWQLGSIKPSFRNFKAICSALNVSPDECILIDDGIKNIIAATEYGFKGIQYKNIEQLKKELILYNILI